MRGFRSKCCRTVTSYRVSNGDGGFVRFVLVRVSAILRSVLGRATLTSGSVDRCIGGLLDMVRFSIPCATGSVLTLLKLGSGRALQGGCLGPTVRGRLVGVAVPSGPGDQGRECIGGWFSGLCSYGCPFTDFLDGVWIGLEQRGSGGWLGGGKTEAI